MKKPFAHLRVSKLDNYYLEMLKEIAADICTEFLLTPPPIFLDVSYQNDSYGHYMYRESEIRIRIKSTIEHVSAPYNTFETNLDTLVHELAHAKTHQEVGEDHEEHGETFQHWFKLMSDYVRKELM